MQDLFNLTMLVLAAMASILLGILAAYAILKAGFLAMRLHSQQSVAAPVNAPPQVARVS